MSNGRWVVAGDGPNAGGRKAERKTGGWPPSHARPLAACGRDICVGFSRISPTALPLAERKALSDGHLSRKTVLLHPLQVHFPISTPLTLPVLPVASVTMSTGKVDAIKQKVESAAAPAQLSGLQLYSRFAFAGAVCCSVTHGALTPVDV